VKHPPKWTADTLRQSAGPPWIIRRLLDSQDLADLWDRLPAAWRERLQVLPEHLGMIRPTPRAKRFPWNAKHRPDAQAAHAARVARLARELNVALRTFAPLAPHRLHQLHPTDDADLHHALALIEVAGRGDCLLQRLEKMAKRFTPKGSALVARPDKAGAWRTYLIRACDALAGRAQWDRIGDRRAFVAGLVNALDPAAACDAEAVKASTKPRAGAIA
jgi:hypothetical protein